MKLSFIKLTAISAMFIALHASATTVPNTFTSGQPASAAAVNQNFQALATAIDSVNSNLSALSARVAKMESNSTLTINDFIGSYKLMMLDTGVGTAYVSVRQTLGTVVFSAVNNGNNIAYTATLTCSANSGEEVSPNSGYGKTTNGVTDVTPFNNKLISGCNGVLGTTLNWNFDQNSKTINLAGTNVVLSPVGGGLLIGRDISTETVGNDPVRTNTGMSLLILVRQ
ncbi:hypothetical protein [Undibacterium squillarum]|uniref:Uncharacterized protein n=1 Tax=Undibacterium squillarum TaxID=1131567 RepID=A0ABQ2XVR3_9BURK|nr:hypothetical protein [Undibacterium squillarum]GGX34158.1 hypothetical protein GCM10010946_09130 [Undibacterium squillarum]